MYVQAGRPAFARPYVGVHAGHYWRSRDELKKAMYPYGPRHMARQKQDDQQRKNNNKSVVKVWILAWLRYLTPSFVKIFKA